MVFDTYVKHDGKLYAPGEDVPIEIGDIESHKKAEKVVADKVGTSTSKVSKKSK